MSKFLMRRAVAIGIAPCFVLIGAMSMAEAGRGGGGFRGGAGHIGGSAFRGGNIHVGGGSVGKFHTNPGGKYAYRGWSGKYDKHHHYGHYRRYGYYPWYGLPLYSYGGGCAYLYRRAAATGSAYWWDRYRRCSGVY